MMEVLIGMIASGKSTYCQKRAAQGAIIVNDDAITMAFHGGDQKLYSVGLKPLYKAIEHTAITMAITMGRDVIVDRPCMERLTRARYLGIGRAFDTEIRAILFPMQEPSAHARRRADHNSRGHTYEQWLKVANKQFADYRAPTKDEGFDLIITPQQSMELNV